MSVIHQVVIGHWSHLSLGQHRLWSLLTLVSLVTLTLVSLVTVNSVSTGHWKVKLRKDG